MMFSLIPGLFSRPGKRFLRASTLSLTAKSFLWASGRAQTCGLLWEKMFLLTAIDLSPQMLDKAKSKYNSPNFTFMEMDAQALTFSPESFDMVIGNLILSVVPDPDQCFQEMIRVTRTGGRIIIFDKFAPSSHELSAVKKILRPVLAMMGTDIGRHFEQIIKPYESHIRVVEDVPALFNGMYRKILLHKMAWLNS